MRVDFLFGLLVKKRDQAFGNRGDSPRWVTGDKPLMCEESDHDPLNDEACRERERSR